MRYHSLPLVPLFPFLSIKTDEKKIKGMKHRLLWRTVDYISEIVLERMCIQAIVGLLVLCGLSPLFERELCVRGISQCL